MKPDARQWYKAQKKPSWAPPGWLFGPVWTVLYTIIALSFGWVFLRVASGDLPFVVALPFLLNLAANFAFSPIQFSLRSNLLASVDIFATLGTLIWAMAAIFPFQPFITYANVPYLLWVCFATVLQLTVTTLNWKG